MNVFGIFVMLKNSNLFPQTPLHPLAGKPFIILSSVESTNNYAMAKLHAGLVGPGASFLAIHQTAGKGQRGKSWTAEPGENITLSTIFQPASPASQPFLLSAATSLACFDFFADYANHNINIKWPNDLYSGDRKAGGILIENVYQGHTWSRAVVGVGININQTIFPPDVSRAVSMKQLTGKSYDIVRMGRDLCTRLDTRYQWMQSTSSGQILEEYNSHLYRIGQTAKLKKENMVFTTTIKGVSNSGDLITTDTMERSFRFGEVEWV